MVSPRNVPETPLLDPVSIRLDTDRFDPLTLPVDTRDRIAFTLGDGWKHDAKVTLPGGLFSINSEVIVVPLASGTFVTGPVIATGGEHKITCDPVPSGYTAFTGTIVVIPKEP